MKAFAYLLVFVLSLCCRPALAETPDETTDKTSVETSVKTPVGEIVFVNKTGATIVSLRLSPFMAEEWSDNLLKNEKLADQDEVKISFTNDEGNDLWDMKTVDQNGEETEWAGISPAPKVVLSFEDGEPIVSDE